MSSSPSRPPWGSVHDCSFFTEQSGHQETQDFFKFQNGSFVKKKFKLVELNSFFWEVNDFTSNVCELRQTGKDKLLALYLGLMTKSRRFNNHREGVFDDYGFRVDKTGATEEELKENGGSLEEYNKFLEKAVDSALRVNSRSDILGKLPEDVKKRTVAQTFVKTKKTKTEKVSETKEEELKAKDGLEMDFKTRFIGRSDIPLRNITVSPDVSLPIMHNKVRGIAKSMLGCYDPTQMVLMVTPVEGLPFNPNELGKNQYHVFHGRHRLLAVKQIEETGRLAELVGFENSLITCHIVNINSGGSLQANYGACRGNQIQAAFTRSPFLHELIYILQRIRQSCEKEKCQETMMRYGKLLSFGPDDLTAVRKFANWSQEGLAGLSEVFKLYETTKTLDAKIFAKRKMSTIQEGKTIEFPRKLFRKLAGVEEDYFKQKVAGIRRKEFSVSDTIENYFKLSKRNSIAALIQEEMGLRSFAEVKDVFPGQFEDGVLDSFAAAIGGKMEGNSAAADLKEYCNSVLEEKVAIPKVSLTVVKKISSADLTSLSLTHTLVFNMGKTISNLVQTLEYLKEQNSQVSIILLFDKHAEQMKGVELLESDENKNDFNPRCISFLKESPKVASEYCENLIHGIVCTGSVYDPPLKQFNGPLCNLENVVNQVSPPGSTIAFLNESNLKILKVHSQFPCEYIGVKSAIDRFSSELNHDIARDGQEEKDGLTEVTKSSETTVSDLRDADMILESFSRFSPSVNSTFVQNYCPKEKCVKDKSGEDISMSRQLESGELSDGSKDSEDGSSDEDEDTVTDGEKVEDKVKE